MGTIEPKGFFAYPSSPQEIRDTIVAGLATVRASQSPVSVEGWEQNDIAGRFLSDPIFSKIVQSKILFADVTRLNFNVTYEIGYAIGLQRRVFLVRNATVVGDSDLLREVGIFDTLGYEQYSNATQLSQQILGVTDVSPIKVDRNEMLRRTPVYLVRPGIESDADLRIVSRIKKTRYAFRSYDPQETGRMSALHAIDNVAKSFGVVVSLVSSNRIRAKEINLKAAFVAGLAAGMQCTCLIIQEGDEPVPLDYRDLVRVHRHIEQIDEYIADFAADVTEQLSEHDDSKVSIPKSFLSSLNLGASAAENEYESLTRYFMPTDQYQKTLRGEVQVVAGRKGAGKTALFMEVRNALRDHKANVVLDLRPEGFQLRKFRDVITRSLAAGSQEHTITAFWEYLLLLEMCHKLLQKDRNVHMTNHLLFEPYRALEELYRTDQFNAEGDFAERMQDLLIHLTQQFDNLESDDPSGIVISRAKLTELLYLHDLSALRRAVISYLQNKAGLWILMDNLDKGWPSHGVKDDDVLILKSLLEAMTKLRHELQKHEIEGFSVLFIRNDVYELLVDRMPDRGKIAKVIVDWDDSELLRELLRLRFVASEDIDANTSFEDIWRRICVGLISGEESSQYLIERSLMRPRGLIDLLGYCRRMILSTGRRHIRPSWSTISR
jgi:hypothetical protein